MRVLLVAANPATEAQIAFPLAGTRSEKTFLKWVQKLGVSFPYPYWTINASCKVAKTTSSLRVKDYNLELIRKLGSSVDKVVALGKYASEGCRRAGIEHFMLPHPSGLNRKLNDPNFIEEELNKCRMYLLKEILEDLAR